MRQHRKNSPQPHRPAPHVAAAISLLAVASVFAFTPASSLASSFGAVAHSVVAQPTPTPTVTAHKADGGGTGPGEPPPPVVGVQAMDAATGFVFPIRQAHQMAGLSSWTLDQGVDLGFGIGGSRGFCGSKTTLVAVDDAVVTKIGINGFGSRSPVIKLTRGPYRGWSVYYGHSQPTIVRVGQVVKRGQAISAIGCGIVGSSSAPHLEFGMFKGAYCCQGLLRNTTVKAILQRMYPTAVARARAAGRK
jgi:murein DD-endopeptidase MepM/ murein hydrolase activator NlpD